MVARMLPSISFLGWDVAGQMVLRYCFVTMRERQQEVFVAG